ncbi:MAG: hypothetical protein K8R12_02640, partial [Desulfobacterales bacterium]|nr:hypothetical protein [Desulfobacterales bacterium]
MIEVFVFSHFLNNSSKKLKLPDQFLGTTMGNTPCQEGSEDDNSQASYGIYNKFLYDLFTLRVRWKPMISAITQQNQEAKAVSCYLSPR